MNRKKLVIAVMSVSVALFAVTAVVAYPSTLNTPLYTVRMEQLSSKMNFLPTTMNDFAYTTENGYNVNYDVTGCFNGAEPHIVTWNNTCEFIRTCPGYYTCQYTCDYYYTCHFETCLPTCPDTCEGCTCCCTCPPTCTGC